MYLNLFPFARATTHAQPAKQAGILPWLDPFIWTLHVCTAVYCKEQQQQHQNVSNYQTLKRTKSAGRLT